MHLAINSQSALLIVETPHLKPTRSAVVGAYRFWLWVAWAIIGFGVYLSFTLAWWSVFVAVLIAGVLVSANTKANQENLLRAAEDDPEFYEIVATFGLWHYEMDDQLADRYRIPRASEPRL